MLESVDVQSTSNCPLSLMLSIVLTLTVVSFFMILKIIWHGKDKVLKAGLG